MPDYVFTSERFRYLEPEDTRRYGVLDTRDQDFLKHVIPLRDCLVQQGYTQKYDFIKFSPFDTISSHIIALNDSGNPIGVVSIIDAEHAKSDILEHYHVPFNPGRTAVCARFCALPSKSGKVSLVGARLLEFAIKSLQAEGYDYLVGEMSPPYLDPENVKGQADVTSYHLNVTGMSVIATFAYADKVPTVVVGKSISERGAMTEKGWRTFDAERSQRLKTLEEKLRCRELTDRYSSFLAAGNW